LLYALPQAQPMIQAKPQMIMQQQHETVAITTQSHRRAITPSPEKPHMGTNNNRRAITPTPARGLVCDYQNLSVIQSTIFSNEENEYYVTKRGAGDPILNSQYQNLNVIQDKIFSHYDDNGRDGYVTKRTLDNAMAAAKKQTLNLHRSLSAESTSISNDGLSIPDHLNQPRRRDSGNWSGDRNSASSSSSTTHDNPYMYMVNKRNGSVPQSPTRNGQFYDAGYDSYSLSSTDSYPPKYNGSTSSGSTNSNNIHLAKIPESVVLSGDCEKLCMEADQLLEKSKLVEDAHDMETALVLCNAASSKARAAMDAPYSNPHTMTYARMKHNTCVMRARSLHRRLLMERGGEMLKEQQALNGLVNGFRHSRQNSRDKSTHSRQSSKELLQATTDKSPKSIEIYATLPKKKVTLKLMETDNIEYEAISIAKPERESRSIFGRSKDAKEKRSRSEDRNKINRDFQISEPPMLSNIKDTLKKHKEEKEEKKEKDKSGKKQHKIRRKLLMGGLIRRKNRSMPDLTDGANANPDSEAVNSTNNNNGKAVVSVDDSSVGMHENKENMSGYLSEGHLEYSISNTNPNLERSKLMRKSFHGSGRMLTMVKVPPPPPIRISSNLTQQQIQQQQLMLQQQFLQQQQQQQLHQQQAQPQQYQRYEPMMTIEPYHAANASIISTMSSNTSMSEESCQTIITCAVVHQEQSPGKPGELMPPPQYNKTKNKNEDNDIDEVDCARYSSVLELPPYPSPPSTTCHSRQASEDFPPPPPDLVSLSSQLSSSNSSNSRCNNDVPDSMRDSPSHMLIQLLQSQHQQQSANNELTRSEIWLRELQNKQVVLKQKKVVPAAAEDPNTRSVRDLASRFEQAKLGSQSASPTMNGQPDEGRQSLSNSGRISTSQELLDKPQLSNVRTGKFSHFHLLLFVFSFYFIYR
jgi:hypothetical protein